MTDWLLTLAEALGALAVFAAFAELLIVLS